MSTEEVFQSTRNILRASKMTPAQGAHASRIAQGLSATLLAKYERGVVEHGGNLWERTPLELVDEALAEVLDQFVYLTTLREKLCQ
jgi:hypothetical protein